MPGAPTQDPSQLGAWLYSCELAAHDEEAAMGATMPDLPLQVETAHGATTTLVVYYAHCRGLCYDSAAVAIMICFTEPWAVRLCLGHPPTHITAALTLLTDIIFHMVHLQVCTDPGVVLMHGRGPGARHSLGSGARMRGQTCCPPRPTLASSSMPLHEMVFATLKVISVVTQVWPHQVCDTADTVSSPLPPSSDHTYLGLPTRL